MIPYLIVLFAITLVYFASAERLIIYIRLIGLQGLLLCGIALFELREINTANLIFIVAETLLFKTILIPYLLKWIKPLRRYKGSQAGNAGFLSSDLFNCFIAGKCYPVKFTGQPVRQHNLYVYCSLYFVYRTFAYCDTSSHYFSPYRISYN